MGHTVEEVRPGVWEVARAGAMRVPARIYASETLMRAIRNDRSLDQACNVAQLPGIVAASLVMPDAHEGYGFPIGGVAAFDLADGIVSPGGVGYDINCGVRLVRTDMPAIDARPRLQTIVDRIGQAVPAGLGSSDAISSLSSTQMDDVLSRGSGWAVSNGFGRADDLAVTEALGCLDGADPAAVSPRARERGACQLGTLGSGNHFVEVQEVAEIHDPAAAAAFGLELGSLTVMIHTGSRGLGYQVCDDALRSLRGFSSHRTDPQLVAAPISSPAGRSYLAAMRAAANFAWANRQVVMALVERALVTVLGGDERALGMRLVFDVAHNIAKVERHAVGGEGVAVLVHRKGATRAFAAGHADVPEPYRHVGQPVLIPGDMGRSSFVCVGTERAMSETFGSCAHGAGRTLSRSAARRAAEHRNIVAEMRARGVLVAARSTKTLGEEMPEAYKDASKVVEALRIAGVARPVVRLRPLGVVKG